MSEIKTVTFNEIAIDEFLLTFAEWQFNSDIFSFKNNEAMIIISKYLYDYFFLKLFKIDPLERLSKRIDWTPELEPSYGNQIKYRTPFGSFIFKRGL